MNNFDTIVKTLQSQIKRAQKKRKLMKADKLKEKLSVVYKLHKMAQKKKYDEQLQDMLWNLFYISAPEDDDERSDRRSESESEIAELVSLQDAELSIQLEKINNLNNNVNQLKIEADMEEVKATAFDFENEQDKSGKSESESEPAQLVSKQLRNTVQSDYCYNPSIDDGEEREDISYEELEAMREEEEAQESSDEEDRD